LDNITGLVALFVLDLLVEKPSDEEGLHTLNNSILMYRTECLRYVLATRKK